MGKVAKRAGRNEGRIGREADAERLAPITQMQLILATDSLIFSTFVKAWWTAFAFSRHAAPRH
jgi:hypothetical protein